MARKASGTQQQDLILEPNRDFRILTGSYARNSNDPKIEQSSASSALEVVASVTYQDVAPLFGLDPTPFLREVHWRHGMTNKDITVNNVDLVHVSDDDDGTTTTNSHDASSDISTANGSEPYSDTTTLNQQGSSSLPVLRPGDFIHIYWKVTTGSSNGKADLFNAQLVFDA